MRTPHSPRRRLRRRAFPALLAIVALLAGGAIALLSGGGAAYGAKASASASHATIKTRHGKLGTFLVDAKGRTLYLFEKDKTSKSTCSGQCAVAWPPAIAKGKPAAAGKAKASLLGTSKRSNGARQVTYHGHPLYRFEGDKAPGQTTGQGLNAFGAKWYVVAPSGKKIDND